MKCHFKEPQSLKSKGIGLIYECSSISYKFSNINDLYNIIRSIANKLSNYLNINLDNIDFRSNEPIGTDYIVYKFRIYPSSLSRHYCSCRVITYKNKAIRIIVTIGDDLLKLTSSNKIKRIANNSRDEGFQLKTLMMPGLPPGQKYIPNFIIYRILGQPKININNWKLKITGLVEKPLELSYEDLLSMPSMKYESDFHCVTGWSVRRVKWEGVSLKYLAERVSVKPGAKWVYIISVDGYSTIVDLKDFLHERSLLVLKMNNEPLSPEQGFPCRIFIPHLYGWKGAKWVSKIIFRENYIDGYWEALGYHERGNVWKEERFKNE